jgi:hypothetical protein
VPHDHPWAQVALSHSGVVRLTVEHGTYIVPPSARCGFRRASSTPSRSSKDADLRTLYLHQPRGRCGPACAPAQRGRVAPVPGARGVGRCCARWCSR